MNLAESPSSHLQDIVSQIIGGDPEKAELFFEALVLTDTSTPRGAAAHADALHECYVISPECYAACREKETKIKSMAA